MAHIALVSEGWLRCGLGPARSRSARCRSKRVGGGFKGLGFRVACMK